MFPMMSLQFRSNLEGVMITIISQATLDFIVFPNFNQSYTDPSLKNHDLAITVALVLLFFGINALVPHLGLADRKQKKSMITKDHQKPTEETHIMYNILLTMIGYVLFLIIAINMFK